MPVSGLLSETLIVLLGWLHGLAAVVFVGYATASVIENWSGAGQVLSAARFKDVTDVSLMVLLITGILLTVDRLSKGAGTTYYLVLAAKVLLGGVAYQFAFRWRRITWQRDTRDGIVVLIASAGVVLLAAALKGIFESGLRGGT